MTKLFRLGPSLVEKNGTGNTVTMALEGIQGTDVSDADYHQNYGYGDRSVGHFALHCLLQWKEAAFLLIIYPVIILFMIILGLAAQTKLTGSMQVTSDYRQFCRHLKRARH